MLKMTDQVTFYTPQDVMNQYRRSELAEALIARIEAHGTPRDRITADLLASIDQMHIRGRQASEELAEAVGLQAGMAVLDLGAGIGGAARVFADRYGARVVALDLTPELCATARTLNALVGLDDRVEVREGDATDTGLEAGSFDRVVTIHATMNIMDKPRLYAEAFRVLKPGGRFGFYDIVEGVVAGLDYPMPWADHIGLSFLVPPYDLHREIEAAGFRTVAFEDLSEVVKANFERQSVETARRREAGEPDPLQVGDILMGRNASAKQRNLRRALKEGRLAVARGVFEKPA